MQPLLVVTLTAFGVTVISAVLSKIIGKEREMEKWSAEIKRCSELSRDAEEVGNKQLYAAFQKQGNEALHKYYAALYCEAVTELFPHIMALGVFQRIYTGDVLHFGFNLWPFGAGIGAIGWYIICALFFHLVVLRKLKKKFSFLL